jgi:23S rRNA (uracil1939-C5)-methyltransferase
MTRRRRRQRIPAGDFEATVVDMSHDGRGVARVDDKATFIQGALPGETVRFRYTRCKKGHDEGLVTEVLQAAPERVHPGCAHYTLCGGCSLQHMAPEAQIAAKQQVLLDNLQHIGKVQPQSVLPPLINDSPWGYRRKARLGVKYVVKKGKVLVGFRERGSAFVAELERCPVLHPRVGELLPQLRELIEGLSVREQLPQIEMAMDDERCVLIFRNLQPLSADDQDKLAHFGSEHNVIPYLQPGGPDTVAPLRGEPVDLHYALPAENLELGFLPGDFTQVNTDINRQMVARAMQMLQPGEGDRVLDLFCGVGNFTLPLARHAGQVVGVEGDQGLVERARQNAQRNALHNIEFHVANLYEELAPAGWLQQSFNKALIDPPRSGALEVLPLLPKLGVDTLLYISCYPGTLARDAGELVHRHGYRLESAGVMDMFPHTAHVESIALFKR